MGWSDVDTLKNIEEGEKNLLQGCKMGLSIVIWQYFQQPFPTHV